MHCPALLPLGLGFCKDSGSFSGIIGLSLFPQIIAFNQMVMGKTSFFSDGKITWL